MTELINFTTETLLQKYIVDITFQFQFFFITKTYNSSPRLRPIPHPLPLRIPELKLPPNILKPLLHNPHPFKPPRFPQLIKRLQINPILFLPIQNRVKITTSFGRIEVGKRLQERIGPDVRVNVDGSLTHDVLEEIVNAVREMDLVEFGGVCEVGVFRCVVVIPVGFSSEAEYIYIY